MLGSDVFDTWFYYLIFLSFQSGQIGQDGEQITKRRFANLIRHIFIIYYSEQLI